ncbi:zinc finger family protein [Dorcoceras hygrometricum]|uniref:Zinc finger family protein n=1 Tax=Dorcoceras hygrometricum TaxID=472368 RepID=A0A2Z7BL85_9LAMI|nr:zinc finger family protein [Dorcoceras hygrometricum]
MNETIDARGKSNEPGMAKVAIVKRKTGSKKKFESNEEATDEAPVEVVSEKVVSKKRPTVVGDEAAITKKKRTTKSKDSSSKSSMDMVSVAQDAVPFQIIEPTPVVTAEQPPVPKRKSKNRRLRLPKGSDDENVEERVAVENVENVEKPINVEVTVGETVVEPTEEERHASAQMETTDDVDVIIGQVIAETYQLATDEEVTDVRKGTSIESQTSDKADEFIQCLDLYYEEFHALKAARTVEQQVIHMVHGKSVGSNQIDEELMTLDDLLMQIYDDMMLPSVTATEITKIKSDLPVEIKEVHDQDWYYASLPKISDQIDEELMTLDDLLMQISDDMMLPLSKISATEKGKAPLEEADTVKGNSAREMVQLICAYVDFLVQLRQQAQQQEHGIIMDLPSSSQSFDDSAASSGAVLAQFYSLAKSTFWVRPMVFVDGIWTPLQGNYYWRSSCRFSIFVNRKLLPERVIVENFVPHGYFIEHVQYWGAAPSIIKSWGWSRICTDVIRYSMFGCLRTVRGINFCRDIVVHSSAVDVLEKIPNNFCSVFQQGIDTNSFVGYFSDLGVQPVLQSVPDIELLSSDGSTVYRSPSSQSDTIIDQDDLMDFHANSDSDEQTSDHQFDLPIITTNVGSTPAVAQFSLPATDIKESFAQLYASIEDIRFEQIRRKDDTDRLRDVLLMHIKDLEKNFTERFDQQDRAYRTFLTNSRKDSQDLRAVLSLDLSTSQNKLSTQVAATAFDTVDVRKEVKELDDKVTYLDGQVAAIRNDLLDFRAKAEENHLNLSIHLGFLVDYSNRGGDAKKGESGSRQPLPPPDDQSRPSGGSGDSGSQRRSGSSNKRRSSGESPVHGIRYGPYPPGAPPKRSAKYWMTGEKYFLKKNFFNSYVYKSYVQFSFNGIYYKIRIGLNDEVRSNQTLWISDMLSGYRFDQIRVLKELDYRVKLFNLSGQISTVENALG